MQIDKKSSPHQPYLLIVANSARMLAQAAVQAGFLPLVIDTYADQDTGGYAEKILCISSLEQKFLRSAVETMTKLFPVQQVIYGSGFENFPESLLLLESLLTVLGNKFNVFNRLQDERSFFAGLNELNISYPEVVYNSPVQDGAWLFKPSKSYGGVGICRTYPFKQSEISVYWQKYQSGIPHSVLFLANGKHSQIIGFNEQSTIALNNTNEFIFSGIINSTELTKKQKTQLIFWVDTLTARYSLRGLNSLDFIQDGGELFILEVNSRPPASMQLYDADLLNRHIKACQGELIDYSYPQTDISGYQVIYASQPCRISENMIWPEGAMDLLREGSEINTGQPICSIIAHCATAALVREQLKIKNQFIVNQIEGLNSWNTLPVLTN